jgi:nicotinamidase-related amidase
MDHAHALLERNRSCLVVIDVQDYFLGKLPLDQRGPLVERIGWLMGVARCLDIPVLATAEDIARNGSMVSALQTKMPAGGIIFDKKVFGLYDQEDIRAAVDGSGCRDFVLVGMETDVCVAHSALGLQRAGYRVSVVDDAAASPPPHHAHGLRRLAAAGIMLTSVKGVYYEWVRDLATDGQVQQRLNRPLPAGLTL